MAGEASRNLQSWWKGKQVHLTQWQVSEAGRGSGGETEKQKERQSTSKRVSGKEKRLVIKPSALSRIHSHESSMGEPPP